MLARSALQHASEPLNLQLILQHLAAGLGQQTMFGIIALQRVVEQSAGGLQLPIGLATARKPLEHQTADPGDIAKLSARQLAGIERRQHVLQQVLGVQQRVPVGFGQLR